MNMNIKNDDHNGLFVARTGELLTLGAIAAVLSIAASGMALVNGLDNKNIPNTQSSRSNYQTASVQKRQRPTYSPRTPQQYDNVYHQWPPQPRQKKQTLGRQFGSW
jgi:hypothetical protein